MKSSAKSSYVELSSTFVSFEQEYRWIHVMLKLVRTVDAVFHLEISIDVIVLSGSLEQTVNRVSTTTMTQETLL